MRNRMSLVWGVLTVSTVMMSTTVGLGAAQASRTPDAQRDLQGVWDFRSLTPLERPIKGESPVLNEEEAAAAEAQVSQRRTSQDSREGRGTDADVGRAYNAFWWDIIPGDGKLRTNRTSLIVDPANGRIPALTEEATKRTAANAAFRRRPAEGPEDRSLFERCITGFNAGPPMLPSAYNNNVQIVQGKDHIVVINEMIHNARIIPIDGRPHLPTSIRQYQGDSRGHWEGNTLVVETTNFRNSGHDVVGLRGSDGNLQLVERFTRVSPTMLTYDFTVTDPSIYSTPWSASIPMIKNSEPLYEYACHEGNYGLYGILSGARSQERAAAAAASKGSQ